MRISVNIKYMNIINAIRKINTFNNAMDGFYSISDLKNIFGIISKDKLYRYIKILEENEILFRFTKGFYVNKDSDFEILSQRISPYSYISCSTIFAKELIIGTIPQRMIYAVKCGPGRIYKSDLISIMHMSICPHLYFGFENNKGKLEATKEKAFIDTLYYYQKGMVFHFNIYTDINIDLLNKNLILEYLKHYKNERFKTFVRKLINA